MMDRGRGTRAKGKTQRTAEVTKLREGSEDYTCNSALLCAPILREVNVNHTFVHKGLCTKRAVFLYCLSCSSYVDIRNAVSVATDNTEIEQD